MLRMPRIIRIALHATTRPLRRKCLKSLERHTNDEFHWQNVPRPFQENTRSLQYSWHSHRQESDPIDQEHPLNPDEPSSLGPARGLSGFSRPATAPKMGRGV